MKRKNEKSPMTKKEYVTYLVLGVGSIILFFAPLVTAAILQENGVSSSIYTPIGLATIPCAIISLVFLFANNKRATEYEITRKIDKIDHQEATVIENVSEEKLKGALAGQKFEERDGYFYKRKFSLSKDYVNYFIRFCHTSDDVASDFERENTRIDSFEYKNQNMCFILIDVAENVTEEDINTLRDFNKVFMVVEGTLPSPQFNSAVYMLLDSNTKKLYLFEMGKMSISIHAHGTNLIKKLQNN